MVSFEIHILAGGLSSRMGQDKARLRIGRRTLLGHVKGTAARLPYRTRVIRKDAIPRCGPMGGMITGLRRSTADAVLFLACDMPNVTEALIESLISASDNGRRSVFTECERQVGFPALIPNDKVSILEKQVQQGSLSIRELSTRLGAVRVSAAAAEVLNVNTPADLAHARTAAGRVNRS